MSKLKCYSKVNLILKINKQDDPNKKHEVESLFVLNKKYYDTVSIKKSNKLEISYRSPIFNINIQNCRIERALKYLNNKYKVNINYKISVEKLIPPSSGLGGSATDAAGVINYLIKKEKIKPSQIDLYEIAERLGSDIPFFMSKLKTAKVWGIGEKIEEIKKLKIRYKVQTFGIESPTEKIFFKLRNDKKYSSKVNYNELLNEIQTKHITKDKTYNDLEQYVLENTQLLKKYEAYSRDYKKVIVSGAGDSLILIK